jgi:cation diffusion facilitator CzcD-associated flavoprotein CzcO
MLKRQISDSKLRRQLFPNYFVGCKRILKSDDYFAAFDRPNVRLHTQHIDSITEDSVQCGGADIVVDVSIDL